jgi:hypothetical protein
MNCCTTRAPSARGRQTGLWEARLWTRLLRRERARRSAYRRPHRGCTHGRAVPCCWSLSTPQRHACCGERTTIDARCFRKGGARWRVNQQGTVQSGCPRLFSRGRKSAQTKTVCLEGSRQKPFGCCRESWLIHACIHAWRRKERGSVNTFMA